MYDNQGVNTRTYLAYIRNINSVVVISYLTRFIEHYQINIFYFCMVNVFECYARSNRLLKITDLQLRSIL